jgi:hypothetical protein
MPTVDQHRVRLLTLNEIHHLRRIETSVGVDCRFVRDVFQEAILITVE